jgi:hypothetical protein
MIWLFTALVILLFVVLAGRAHSRHLDAQEARWRSLTLNDSLIDKSWDVRTRRDNVDRYRQLLQTELTELERRRIERRLNEEKSAIESMTSATAPLQNAFFVVFADRAHGRHLDPQEARWRSPSPSDSTTDENWEHLRIRSNNVRRYRQLLQTELTELERRHIERRLNEERSAIACMTSSTAPLHNP